MLLNVLRRVPRHRVQCDVSLHRSKNLCSATVNESKNDFEREQKKRMESEVESMLAIEANLFGNSKVKHDPILKTHALKYADGQYNKVKHELSSPAWSSRSKVQRTEAKVIDDVDTGLQFVSLKLHDPILNELLTTVRSKKRRDKEQQIVVEGHRLVHEALLCQLRMKTLIFSEKEALLPIKDDIASAQREMKTKIFKVPRHDIKIWSTLTTPPGIMAIFDRPQQGGIINKFVNQQAALPLTVVCDNIREPNNLGSIIRSCAAIPCYQVIVTRGCCDPWNSKALRGGCGGQFRVTIRDNVTWEDLPLLIPPETASDCCVFIAENKISNAPSKAETINYMDVQSLGAHNIVIIGGESHGISQDAFNLLQLVGNRGKCVYIPLANGVESLNVTSALTLILYELKRRLENSKLGGE